MTEPTPSAEPGTQLAPADRRSLNLGSIVSSGPGGRLAFLPQSMEECVTIAQLMAKSDFAVPPKFRGNPGACLAVAMQSARWGADPFAVVQKAYVTKAKDGSERLAYEAQLVAAVVNTMAPIHGRLALHYSGEGNTRKVKCIGIFKDTGEPREVETPQLTKISPRNSPLWVSDPDQQLAYYVMRAWGRRWVPEVLLGIYTPEELQVIEGDPNAPRPQRQPAQVTSGPSAEETGITPVAEPEPAVEVVVEEEPVVAEGIEVTREEVAAADAVRGLSADNDQALGEEPGALDAASLRDAQALSADEDSEEERAHQTALDSWEAYLVRAKDGLVASELKTEADLDEYAAHTKAAIASADGITEDERDDLRARFVSAYLQRKRDMGLTRRGR